MATKRYKTLNLTPELRAYLTIEIDTELSTTHVADVAMLKGTEEDLHDWYCGEGNAAETVYDTLLRFADAQAAQENDNHFTKQSI